MKNDIFEPDEIKLNIGQIKINIGTPMRDGNVYLIENEAFHLKNVNTEKDQDQKFISKKRALGRYNFSLKK